MFFSPPAPRRKQFIDSNLYFEALRKLDGNQTVRIKTNNKGLATSAWHRFEVAFMDLFARSETARAREKARSWQIFNQQLTERFITQSGTPLNQKEITDTVERLTKKSRIPLDQKETTDAVDQRTLPTMDWLNGELANTIVKSLYTLAELKGLDDG